MCRPMSATTFTMCKGTNSSPDTFPNGVFTVSLFLWFRCRDQKGKEKHRCKYDPTHLFTCPSKLKAHEEE